MIAYFGLGSNIEDRQKNIQYGLQELEKILRDFRAAQIYESAAVDYVDQPAFLNTVCSGECNMDALELLQQCHAIEAEAGRIRNIPKGPRTLDIDLLLYGETIMNDPTLTIPHPGMQDRRFVLVPLLELCPDCKIPNTDTYYNTILPLTETQTVKLWNYKN